MSARRAVQAPFATDLEVSGQVKTVNDAYGSLPGEELGEVGAVGWPAHQHPRAPRTHTTPPYAAAHRRAPLPPIGQPSAVSTPTAEQRRSSPSSSGGDGQRIQLEELESRVRRTEGTAKTLLREALVASAEIDRAWQMLASRADPRQAAATNQQHKHLLKEHIRAITEVVQQLTNELDQLEVNATREVRQLATGLAETKRVQQHAVGALTASQRAGQAAAAQEIRKLQADLTHARQDHEQLAAIVESQATDMQKMSESFTATLQALAARHEDDAAAARVERDRLRADNEALARGLDGILAAVGTTNKTVAAHKAELDNRLSELQAEVADQVRSEITAAVETLQGEIAEARQKIEATQSEAAARDVETRRACEHMASAKLTTAKAEAVRLGKGLEQAILKGPVRDLHRALGKIDATFNERLERLLNTGRDDFFASKDDLQALSRGVEARWASTETRVLGDIAVLQTQTADAEAKLDMLGAMLHNKTNALENKLDKQSFVVLAQ
mmetsp:Transcript_37366/g.97953  ORF Transcript_37366/g.97953 Transcript_37366/m.97953 type:complete len:502 (+) Transcript_37366:461-1966(+)|eukprot:CAMPEP_0182920150 /NCGR_PEP_ID=MMETSP0105_2-20130417/3254_1 /TAXON_ID=81532 ORGANISM="Acanthoeca-like sp., Strain 10tr" /NCGR_SAMPLE_ID=MMETSP0105_2 /ASSEMBLY_ACC=CAM_ASM_000205 /LENGTH=501 /DNA_ID=CAMNT_0025057493 /DNA_START=398 /DNA_END=1903 /DNA_ORIENTATION=-